MLLPPDFTFSQTSLQDFVDCPRRFELRYLLRVEWPALQSEPVLAQEAHMQQGRQFHSLVQQHQMGLPVEDLTEFAVGNDLSRWWGNYLLADPCGGLPAIRKAEFTLVMPFSGYRLAAKYDLLAVEPGERMVILDWKTSRFRPAAVTLRRRMQTRLYPFIAVGAGAGLNSGQVPPPEQVCLIYWFADFPNEPEVITYNQASLLRDQADLQALVSDISTRQKGAFPLTGDEKVCAYCVYRSLCERGSQPGGWNDMENEPEETDQPLDIDFEQIGEISF